jgi:hypothetical protein
MIIYKNFYIFFSIRKSLYFFTIFYHNFLLSKIKISSISMSNQKQYPSCCCHGRPESIPPPPLPSSMIWNQFSRTNFDMQQNKKLGGCGSKESYADLVQHQPSTMASDKYPRYPPDTCLKAPFSSPRIYPNNGRLAIQDPDNLWSYLM